ncbi:F-box/kelch-repeat protein At3g06240-like [Corylus avellana]|uniref:F-box/kelch-repeat protein At3g06240-like n=1 Tax=Corylus avellana TaxID=13451 RepID=UPI00286B26BD|nr:F-box/kelch-repeat protein At3g06240-like [Corylus avellana]
MAARQANQSETAMAATLPYEIMEEILSRLPIKSLCRLRCVSKLWRFLISDPHFIKMHLKRRSMHKVFMSFIYRCKIQFFDYEALFNGDDDQNSAVKNLQLPVETGSIRSAKLLGSCNGLLCLGLGERNVIVWNPCIREYKKLQEPQGEGDGSYGFGYDSCNDDYKLVRVIRGNGSEKMINVDVFSLKTSSWRRICYGGCKFDLLDPMGTFFNGSVYWQAKHGGDTDRMTLIVSFDLVEEKFRELPKPDGSFAAGPMLGVLGECLCACCSEFRKGVELWAMEEEGAEVSWIKLANVSRRTEPAYVLDYSIPLCFAKNGEALILQGGLKVDAYNLQENRCRRIFISPYELSEFDGVLYLESLVSPNAYDGAHGSIPRTGGHSQEKVEEVEVKERLERFDLG